MLLRESSKLQNSVCVCVMILFPIKCTTISMALDLSIYIHVEEATFQAEFLSRMAGKGTFSVLDTCFCII